MLRQQARDIGQRFNHLFGKGKELFAMPEAVIEADVATLPGLDGRKMSKSYDNTIPLFSSSKELKSAISRIVTDSKLPGEAKDPSSSHLFTLYQAFSSRAEQVSMRADLEAGLAWGEAKQRLFTLLDEQLAEPRERYHAFMAQPNEMEEILQAGAVKARKVATPFLQELREAVGLRSFAVQGADVTSSKKKAKKASRVVSFRDDEGFRFRVLTSKGEDLLLSKAFADGRAAGMASKHVQTAQDSLDIRQVDQQLSVWFEDECIAQSSQYGSDKACQAALEELRNALATDS